MPYIKQELRSNTLEASTPGELNYHFTRLIQDYLDRDYFNQGPPNYQKFNDVIGALECCKLELYRRMVIPYEEKKIKENGDVY